MSDTKESSKESTSVARRGRGDPMVLILLSLPKVFPAMAAAWILSAVSSFGEDTSQWANVMSTVITRVGISILIWTVIRILKSTIQIVPPGYRKVLISVVSGEATLLESGSHLWFPTVFYRSFGCGPFRGITNAHNKYGNHLCPAPGTQVLVDPPQANVTTLDKIHGTVDVSVTAAITQWQSETIIESASQQFATAAGREINRWIASVVGEMNADDVTFYSISDRFNDDRHLTRLNALLARYCLKVRSVNLDPSAIKLSPKYTAQRDKINADLQLLAAEERTCAKRMSIQKLQEAHDRRAIEIKSAFARMEEKSKIEAARAEKKIADEMYTAQSLRIKRMIDAGLSPNDVASLMVCEEAGKSLVAARCEKVIAVPPSMYGLYGLGALSAGIRSNAGGDGSWTAIRSDAAASSSK